MDFGDSRFALFCEPNAYVQNHKKEECDTKGIKKIVFQEPYESLPTHYINNDFKKHNCDCVAKPKQNNLKFENCHDSFCNHEKPNSKCGSENNTGHSGNKIPKGFQFDLKSLLPMLGMFNKGGGMSQLVGLLNNGNNQTGDGSNPMNLISSLMSNKDIMSGIMKFFGGGEKFSNGASKTENKLKTTDFEIKNYTRVE